jgi:hypothetical protein
MFVFDAAVVFLGLYSLFYVFWLYLGKKILDLRSISIYISYFIFLIPTISPFRVAYFSM